MPLINKTMTCLSCRSGHLLPFGTLAVSGQLETASSVLSTALQAKQTPGAAALVGSSTDSVATYQQAHAAAAETAKESAPQDRVCMLYEEQTARAIKASYRTWLEDKQNRDKLCAEIQRIGEESSTSAAALMDIEPAAFSKSRGSHQ